MLVVANCAHEIESKYLAHIITRTLNFELTQQTTTALTAQCSRGGRRVGIKEKIPFSIFISHSSRIFLFSWQNFPAPFMMTCDLNLKHVTYSMTVLATHTHTKLIRNVRHRLSSGATFFHSSVYRSIKTVDPGPLAPSPKHRIESDVIRVCY